MQEVHAAHASAVLQSRRTADGTLLYMEKKNLAQQRGRDGRLSTGLGRPVDIIITIS